MTLLDDGSGPTAFAETVEDGHHAITREGEVRLPTELHYSVRNLLDHGFNTKP
ncbi:hypothetical protein ACLUS2_003130 [Curtobacterium flaccumfaciens pv. flaccumfaciens]|uniref:hypothetical protein n=1 Tax=Curtobacterium flaccumfaciens TaxID=2035 RepID=UPI003B003D0F